MATCSDLARESLRQSTLFRKAAGRTLYEPVNPVDIALELGVKVRYLDISMEGMYVRGKPSRIMLSALRPLVRRAYTCAHELGHHWFGHGSTVDQIEDAARGGAFQPEEFLAETFAGYLLMPPPAIRKAFLRRGLQTSEASPLDVARVACEFGVGYETLVTQLAAHDDLTPEYATKLRRLGLAHIRRELKGCAVEGSLYAVDDAFTAKTLDVEVGAALILPKGVKAGLKLHQRSTSEHGDIYTPQEVGIERVWSEERDWGVFVRISRAAYVGVADYRHLEDPDA